MFKILFSLILIFLNINSYASEIKKDLDEVLNLSIEPYCGGYSNNLEGLELKQLKSLKLKLNNSRKFVKQTLENMGHKNIEDVRQGKYFEIELNEKDKKNAEEIIEDISKKLLTNTVIEDYAINYK